MNWIKNGVLTAVLILVIAAAGIFIPSFFLKNVEKKIIREETLESQEEVLVTEIETERLPLILQAVEEDTLSKEVQESGENITKERARSNFLYAVEELMLWGVDDLTQKGYHAAEELQNLECILLAVPNHPSVNVYQVTYDGRSFGVGDLDIVGVMDARSGLLVSVKLSGQMLADSGMAVSEITDYSVENSAGGTAKITDAEEDYFLQMVGDLAMIYYASNTSFQFQYQKTEEKNLIELKSRDGEYKLEIKREDASICFQLKKNNL